MFTTERISEVHNEDCMIGMARYPDKAAIAKQKKAVRMKKWREDNKERCDIVAKKYRDANRDEWNAKRNNYRKKNPKGIYDVLKGSSTRRGMPFEMARDEFAEWYVKQERVCIYCKRSEDDVINSNDIIQTKSHRLTVDRLDNSVGYKVSNIGLCCRRCNTIKGNFFTQDEMMQVGVIIQKKFSENA